MKVLILFRTFLTLLAIHLIVTVIAIVLFVFSTYQSNEWNLCIRFSHLTLCIAHNVLNASHLSFSINHVKNGHVSIGYFGCFEFNCEWCVVLKGLLKSQVRSTMGVWRHHSVCCKQILVLYWSAFFSFVLICYLEICRLVSFFLFLFLSSEMCSSCWEN